jgi:glucose-1-phosphate thymidylyltransferase
MSLQEEIVGLIPAGGQATRLSPLPCSKELVPIGWQADEMGKMSPKVVSHFLLDKYKKAGIRKTYFILRKGKWDIPQYYGDGAMVDMDLAYLIMNLPHGHPFTLDQAFPFIKNNLVAFGYPDVLFEPEDAFSHLIRKQAETKASVVLGIFPIRPDQRWKDILSFGENRKIQTIALSEPSAADQRVGWSIALWTPEFSLFMHKFLLETVKQNRFTASDGKEYTMNHVLQAALDKGLSMEAVVFDSGFVLVVGTPVDLFAAKREQLASAKIAMEKSWQNEKIK